MKELSAFAGDNPFGSLAAFQLREQAQADLAVNPVFLCQSELQAAQCAVEETDARVRQAALRVADAKPQIFNTLLTLVSEAAANALRAALMARNEERAAIAAIQSQADQHPSPLSGTYASSENFTDSTAASSPVWSRMPFPRPLALQRQRAVEDESAVEPLQRTAMPYASGQIYPNGRREEGQAKKTFARLGRIWAAAASAGAGVLSFLV